MEKTRGYILPGSILIAVLTIAGAVFYSASARNGEPSRDVGLANIGAISALVPSINENDVILGDPNAPITIIQFSDYQCLFCVEFFIETGPLIRKNYIETGKANMVYKDFAFLGKESIDAANAARCAKDQGRFWAYHDALYAEEERDGSRVNNGNLNEALFMRIASDLGMDVGKFSECYKSGKYNQVVQSNIKEAQDIMGLRASTPTFFINDRVMQGAVPYQAFAQTIDSLLKAQQ